MDSLALDTTYTLLEAEPDPEISPDPALAHLAHQVNQFFGPKAKAALQQKRAQLASQGHEEVAARTEITVLLTGNGLQLGFSHALARKELAPAPHKSLLRTALGPLYPGRKYWVMPETDAEGNGQTYTVWWPWIFWALLAVAVGGTAWWFTGPAGLESAAASLP
jgi:hypothetical protein